MSARPARRRAFQFVCFLTAIFLAWWAPGLQAQTSPAPQAVPCAQNFGVAAFSTLPSGFAAWSGNGGSLSSEAAAAGSAPTADAAVGTATMVQTTGGAYGYGAGADGRFYVQTSSNATNGANQLVLALNTTGASALTIDYDVEIISAQPRTVGVLCQYRIGTSGTWTTFVESSGANPYSQAGGTAGVKTSPHIVLPVTLENRPVVQIRWATWRGTETGNSSGIAVDNIVVGASSANVVLSASVAPASVSESAGANAATLTVTRTGDTVSALPVTLVIGDPTEAAYDGPNPLSIPAGQSSVDFAIRAVDDDGFDGSQSVSLQVSAPGAVSASDTLLVLDDDDANSPPPGYYDAASGLSASPLKAALKTIASPANYHQYDYSDTYAPLRIIWEDPNNAANIITTYSGTSLGKNQNYFPGGPSGDVSWSREHVWPDSFGLDPGNVNPGSTDGNAGADFTDLFNLRPCLQTVNSQRGNLYYDFTTGTPTVPPLAPACSRDSDSWEPREVEKGELARTIFYMAMRYDGTDPLTLDLEVANTPNTSQGRFANLAALLRWNDLYPPTLEERRRNQLIYSNYQRNRNPFIDHPEYINRIWGYVRIEKLAAAVTEGGTGDSYTVVLGSQPTADVVITLTSTSASQMTVSPGNLTFTTANWDQPQVVTVSAVNDAVNESVLTARVQHTTVSSDARYSALAPLDVVVTVNDNDAPAEVLVAHGGPWSPLPGGFTGVGVGTYDTSLGGDTGTGSARFDSTGDQLTISFNAAPATLSYQLKGNPSSGNATEGTFLVRQSADNVNYTTVRTVTNKDNSDQAFADQLAPGTRYVRFVYSEKIGGNLQLDKLVITAAAPFVSWASAYGLNGAEAQSNYDFDLDGLVNLVEYALGLSPVAANTNALVYDKPAGKLRLTTIVRTGDTSLNCVAQANTDLTNPNGWTTTGVFRISGVDQTGVAVGFERVVFEVDDDGATRRFLRLRFDLP